MYITAKTKFVNHWVVMLGHRQAEGTVVIFGEYERKLHKPVTDNHNDLKYTDSDPQNISEGVMSLQLHFKKMMNFFPALDIY